MPPITSAALCLLAGALTGASTTSPEPRWWVPVIGMATLFAVITDRDLPTRTASGWLYGLGSFGASFAWAKEFSQAGAIVLVAIEALFPAAAAALTLGRSAGTRATTFVAATAVTELARWRMPFGGIPYGGPLVAQVDGPFANLAPLAGPIGALMGCTAAAAMIASTARALRRPQQRHLLVLMACTLIGTIVWAPMALGGVAGEGMLRVAVVQGGGALGLERARQSPGRVLAGHYLQTQQLRRPVDLILWPEDVIHVDQPVEETRTGLALSGLALQHHAYLAAGVVTAAPGSMRFHNEVVVWAPDGHLVARYEKNHPVPFGERIPGRSLLSRFIDLGPVPLDAVAGHGAKVVDLGSTRAAVAVSFEGMFTDQVRAGVRQGGAVVLLPTNAASYRAHDVARTELAMSRLRAMEVHRWVVQAAPTGISAIIDPRGKVVARSGIGLPDVLTADITLDSRTTPYERWGHWPAIGAACLAILTAATPGALRRRGRSRASGSGRPA